MNTFMALALAFLLWYVFTDGQVGPYDVDRHIESVGAMTTEAETDPTTGHIYITTYQGNNRCVTSIEKSREVEVACFEKGEGK